MIYRPDIDGLRAIAVLAVMAYHYGVPGLTGGFVGVDVFFVISGFLITGLLRQQIAAGRFSVAAFYGRRVRRILPALLVVVAGTIGAGSRLLLPGDYASLGESAAYAAVGAGNLFFFWNTGYFDRAAELQPLLHTWSLGVEEQFYLVWPLLLAGVARMSGRWPRAMPMTMAAVVAGTFAWSLLVMTTAPKTAFYLAHLRAWELATGALVTFAPILRSRRLATTAGVLGVGLVALPVLILGADDPFPGWNAVPPVLGTALLVWPRPGDPITQLLSWRPLQHIGLVSYSLYLWHWPVLVFYRHYASGEMPDAVTRTALAAAAYAVALASWRWVEQPCRRMVLPNRAVLAGGLAAVGCVALLGGIVRAAEGFPARFGEDLAGMESLDTMWEWPCPRTMAVEGLGVLCNFGVPWNEATTKGVLWGDSHAEHMAPIVEAAIAGRRASFLLLLPCPAVYDEDVRREVPETPRYADTCASQRRRATELLQAIPEVRLVVLASAWDGISSVVSTRPGAGGLTTRNGGDLIEVGLTRLFTAAAAPGRHFVVIGQVPQVSGDPVPCLAAASGLWRRGCATLDRRFGELYDAGQRAMDARWERLAAGRADVVAILPGARLCADGSCVTRLNGQPLYRDGNHIRRNLRPDVRRAYAERIGMVERFAALLD